MCEVVCVCVHVRICLWMFVGWEGERKMDIFIDRERDGSRECRVGRALVNFT